MRREEITRKELYNGRNNATAGVRGSRGSLRGLDFPETPQQQDGIEVGRPILAAAGFSRLPVLPRPPGDIQAHPLFHEISRAEGPLQQTTKTDGLSYAYRRAALSSSVSTSGESPANCLASAA